MKFESAHNQNFQKSAKERVHKTVSRTTEIQKFLRVKVLVPNIQNIMLSYQRHSLVSGKKNYLLSNVAMYTFETKTKTNTNICLFHTRPQKCLNLLNILWFIHILQWELFSLLLSSWLFHAFLVPDTLKKRIFLY